MAAGDRDAFAWYYAAHAVWFPGMVQNLHRCSADKAATVAAWDAAAKHSAEVHADISRGGYAYRRGSEHRAALYDSLTMLAVFAVAFVSGYVAGARW